MLHRQLHRTVTVPSLLPQLPATRFFGKLEPLYLQAKQAKLQDYLQALVGLDADASPTSSASSSAAHLAAGHTQGPVPLKMGGSVASPAVLRAVQARLFPVKPTLPLHPHRTGAA